ncbi:MAG: fibronectin type III domain-containing protein [Polyangiaceae bacterium]|nr:fibronectin type III domain-containing protein [Polyangiaceae bacterium]
MKSKSFGVWLAVACAVSGAAAGCGGGEDEQGLTCGEGTVQKDQRCVASGPGAAGSAGAAQAGAAGSAQAGKAGAAGSVAGAAGTSAAGASGAAGAGGKASSAPTFGGVTAVAPISPTGLLIAWAPATDDVSVAIKIKYNVYVASAAGGQTFSAPTATSAPGATSLELSAGLTADTPYFVVVRAVDEAGNEDTNTKEKSATTKADTAAPTFAGAVSAASADAGAVTLTWAAGTDDLTPPEGLVYYAYAADATGAQSFTAPAAVSEPGATSVVVTGLSTPDAPYFFVVRARDAAGNLDANTKEVTAKAGPDTTAPTFSGCASATTLDAGSVSVTWKPGADDTTSAKNLKVNVYAATASGAQDFSTPQGTFVGGTSGVVTGLKSATSYFFVCRAADASGNEEKNKQERSAKTLEDNTPPTFKGLAKISNLTASSVDLEWEAATDDKTAPADLVYDVFQATAAGTEDFTKPPLATSAPGATTLTVPNLKSATTYYFVVRARDKAGNRDTNTVEKSESTFVSLKTDVQPFLTDTCASDGCHSNNNPQATLTLTKGFSYASMVGVASVEKPAELRVAPGDPSKSYLYKKATGSVDIVGQAMPPGAAPPLTAPQKELLRLWIVQGAPNN